MKVYTLSCFLLGTLALALAGRPDAGSLDAATIAMQELDRVLSLPGQPSYSPAFKQYSGYVTTDEYLGKALFYWFLEAMDKPDENPLVLWLNGGPGCSSIGSGQSQELGPFLVKKNVPELEVNPYAWNQGNCQSAVPGLSSGGHFVPQLANLILEENRKASEENYINFKGILIGNPYMDGDTDLWGIVDSAWHHAIISDNLYNDFQKNCNFSLVDLSPECIADLVQYNALDEIIDIYSLYTDRCELGYPDSNTSFSVQIGRTSNGRVSALSFNARIPTTSTRYTLKKLGLPIKEDWSPWFHHKQVGGWTVVYDGLTFVTVRGAGHMVPLTKPEQALELFKHFLANTNLSSKPF
ncbi:hypothetical protein HU200_035280 [Digitaria exilis]|uniref:Uncharacterized protein n=1 Tax=Digitaria exilis TaxID=1010633 RepID=A0A835BH68_9POAL|nr:hypothetical protein HU200_035280 [Digitaria exilis]